MKLGVLCKTPIPEKVETDFLNFKAWSEMGRYFDGISIVALNRSKRRYVTRRENLRYILIPGSVNMWLQSFLFCCLGMQEALQLAIKKEVDVWVSSDVAIAGVVGVAMKKITRKPLLVHLQGEIFNLPEDRFSAWRSRLSYGLARWVCLRADTVRAVSDKVRLQALSAGIPEGKLKMLPSRCDTRQFDPVIHDVHGKAIRKSLGYEEHPVLVFVGSLNTSKGVEYILRALKTIRVEFPNIRLLIVGDGPLESELKNMSVNLELESCVHFWGRAPYKDVPALLVAGDIFVSPSLDEGMPRAVLEAMSMELPVVVSHVGGNPEIVVSGKTGILVPPKNIDALTDAVVEILRQGASRLGRAARRNVVAGFSFHDQIKKLSGLHIQLKEE